MNVVLRTVQWSQIRTAVWLIAVSWLSPSLALAGAPYLTGVVEDGDSQTIEMPNLPFTFRSQVGWLAPEGSYVEVGDVVVRIEPGNLVEQAEALEAAYEEMLVAAESSLAEHALVIIDAETALEVAKTAKDLAWLDAQVPATAVTQLIYDRAQLALENAENALTVAEETLANAELKFEELRPVLDLRVNQAKASWLRVRDALGRLAIKTERSGIMIYAENEFSGNDSSGMKIFAGETLMPGHPIATVASREQLQFVFWVHDADINQLNTGQKLLVIADALPKLEIEAEVDWVGKYATARENWSQGGYFKLIASPTSPMPDSFIPGMAISAETL